MKIKRTLWLDILKIIACFLVIVNHAGGYVLGNNPSKITILFYCVNFAICKIAGTNIYNGDWFVTVKKRIKLQ